MFSHCTVSVYRVRLVNSVQSLYIQWVQCTVSEQCTVIVQSVCTVNSEQFTISIRCTVSLHKKAQSVKCTFSLSVKPDYVNSVEMCIKYKLHFNVHLLFYAQSFSILCIVSMMCKISIMCTL